MHRQTPKTSAPRKHRRTPSQLTRSLLLRVRKLAPTRFHTLPRRTRTAIVATALSLSALFILYLLWSLISLFWLVPSSEPRPLPPSLQPSLPSKEVRSATARILSHTPTNFTLDGRPIRIISGSVHYFRIPPSRWRDVLVLARHMGLNAIETYVPWNLHEPYKNVFRFSGILDLPRFLSLAHQVGLLVLLRPGPYICSEWDLGGLPSYLLSDPRMRLRSSYQPFLDASERYIQNIARVLLPYVGRPIVAVQLENEFGSYGDDHKYMEHLLYVWNHAGFTRGRIEFFTSDHGQEKNLKSGSPFSSQVVVKTINFGDHPEKHIQTLRKVQSDAPLLVGEFWTGWFDQWGVKHAVKSGEHVAALVREILFIHDASINLYMFMGGTNFGFMSGAKHYNKFGYRAVSTNYDYDAMLTEYAGIRSSKYDPMREVLRAFWTQMGDKAMIHAMDTKAPPVSPPLSAYSRMVPLTSSIPLFDVLEIVSDVQRRNQRPLSMEELGGTYGYMLYRHHFRSNTKAGSMLQISGVYDHAFVLFDGSVSSILDRNNALDKLESGKYVPKRLEIPPDTRIVDIFLENSGRINYGNGMHEHKGIGKVMIDEVVVSGFDIYTMSFAQDHPLLREASGRNTIDSIIGAMHGNNTHMHAPLGKSTSPPALFYGTFVIQTGTKFSFLGELPSTFIRVFGRGSAWVNGFHVGRFNTEMPVPQRTLFVPGEVLREGKNTIVVLHTDLRLAHEPPQVRLVDRPEYGPGQ